MLDPGYSLPSRQALKKILVHKYEEEKREAKAVMQRVEAVSLTADMWTSIKVDAYLVVTCHYVDDSTKLATVLLDVRPGCECHSACHITAASKALMEEWAIEAKVTSFVRETGANMVASVKKNRNLRHALFFTHLLNLDMKK